MKLFYIFCRASELPEDRQRWVLYVVAESAEEAKRSVLSAIQTDSVTFEKAQEVSRVDIVAGYKAMLPTDRIKLPAAANREG